MIKTKSQIRVLAVIALGLVVASIFAQKPVPSSTIRPISPVNENPEPEINPWYLQFEGWDVDGNGISDFLDLRLEEGRINRIKNPILPSLNLKLVENVNTASGSSVIEDPVKVIIHAPETHLEQVLQLFEKYGGNVKSNFSPFLQAFAGGIDSENLDIYYNVLQNSKYPFFIEEDGIVQAEMYYAGKNMNLRPYVWNTLGYDGDNSSAIAIIDTGIDESHVMHSGYTSGDYGSKIVGWRDETANNIQTAPYDDNGHGSHCAGIATGEGTTTLDGSGRTVATTSMAVDYAGQSTYSFYDIVFNLTVFNVTTAGLLDVDCEFDDRTPSPDYLYCGMALYHDGVVKANYSPGTTTWTTTLSYDVLSNETGIYNVLVTINPEDGDSDYYCSDFAWALRAQPHWFFNPDLMGAGNAWQGVANDTHLVGVKVMDANGAGYASDVIDGVNWVIANKQMYNITVISLSLGGLDIWAMVEAVTNAVEAGIVVVTAAGNDGVSGILTVPATVENAITVAALNSYDQITSYSTKGGGNTYPSGITSKPDVAAPGGSVNSLQMFSTDTNDNDASGYYSDWTADDLAGMQGTSMATPAVAGAANLLIEAMGGRQNWNYSAVEAKRVKALLLMTATETFPLLREGSTSANSPVLNRGGKDVHEGYGRINIDMALEAFTQEFISGTPKSATLASSNIDPSAKHGFGSYVNLIAGNSYYFTLDVPEGADFDLHLYNDDPTSIGEPILVANGSSSLLGGDELLFYSASETGRYYLIVKAISGSGLATLNSVDPEHELSVSLNAPSSITLGNAYCINATVRNDGSYTESSVNLTLVIDDMIMNSSIIPSLFSESTSTINYSWTPLARKAYNITVYALPVLNEFCLWNNQKSSYLYTPPSEPQNLQTIAGNGNITLTWDAPASNGGSPITSYRILRGTTSGGELLYGSTENITTYTNTGLTNDQTYYYTVQAVNVIGVGPSSLEVSDSPTGTLPTAPQNLQVIPLDAKNSLTWGAPANDGGYSITNYLIYRGMNPGEETLLTTLGNVLTYNDTGLTNNQTYYYRISANTSKGEGPLSSEVSGRPRVYSLQEAVDNDELVFTTGGDADWYMSTTSSYYDGDAARSGLVYFSYSSWMETTVTGAGSLRFYFLLIADSTYDELSITVDGVEVDSWQGGTAEFQEYVVATTGTGSHVIRWIFTADMYGPVFDPACYAWIDYVRWIPNAPPSAPQNPQAVAGHEKVFLTWEAPLSNGNYAITNYRIFQGTTSGGENVSTTIGNLLSYNDTGLTDGQTYFYTIVAVNSIGDSPNSTEVSAVPEIMVPTVPLNVQAVPADSQITLTWNAPASDEGAAITNYTIYRGMTSGGETLLTTVGDVLTYIDTGLTNKLTYYYLISANNSVGEGPRSSEVSGIPSIYSLPEAVDNNAFTFTTGGNANWYMQTTTSYYDGDAAQSGLITHSQSTWMETTVTGSGKISFYYRVSSEGNYDFLRFYIDGTQRLQTSGTGSSSFTLWEYSVTTGTHTFRWIYSKDGSVSSGSDCAWIDCMKWVEFFVPSAPQNLQAAAGIRQVALTWESPNDDGGSSITGYNIYRSTTSGGETLLTSVGSVLAYNDTSVASIQTYYYRISAVNIAGESTQSNEASATTPSAVPGAPLNLQAAAGNTQVTLTWQTPADNGGSPITNYLVYQGTTSGGETLLATLGNVSTYTDTGLSNGQIYYYKVSAINDIGPGSNSTEASATPATVPDAPQYLLAGAGASRVTLNWTAPGYNGGSPITNYRIYRGTTTGGESLLTTLGNVSTFTDYGLTNSQTYYYTVAAVNVMGNSSHSNEVYATPFNVPAVLATASLTPHYVTEWNTYTFRVSYYDEDNIAPAYVNLVVLKEGVAYGSFPMSKTTPSDVNYMDGASYTLSRLFEIGTYQYYFEANDTVFIARYPATTYFEDLIITPAETPIFDGLYYNYNVGMYMGAWGEGTVRYTRVSDTTYNCSERYYYYNPYLGGSTTYSWNIVDIHTRVILSSISSANVGHKDHNVIWNNTRIGTTTEMDGNNIPYGTFPCVGSSFISALSRSISCWKFESGANSLYFERKTGLLIYTFNNLGGGYTITKTITSTNLVLNDYPVASGGGALNNTAVPQNSTSINIDWVITDTVGGTGTYQVLINGTPYVSWTSWTSGSHFYIPVDTNRGCAIFEYTLQYQDMYGLFGTEINVVIEVYQAPLSNHPSDAVFLQGSPEDNITWILTDDVGAGWYHVLRNNEEIVAWTEWVIGTEINVTVQTSLAIGFWNYTIQFNNSAGRFGAQDTVNVTIDDLPIVSDCMYSAQVPQNSTSTITWVLSDQIGAGNYTLLVDDVPVPYLTNIPWANNTDITIPIDTNHGLGTFEYTLQFCDSNGFEGVESSVLIEICGIPQSTHPDDLVFLQGAPADNITWILTDEDGAGWYHVLRNGEEIVAWTTWTIGAEINVTVQTGLAVGYWNYTIQFNNTGGWFGVQDTVNVTIDDFPNVLESPIATQVPQNSTSTITWVLSDQIGAGNYTLLVDDVPVPYLTNIPWANNTDITIPIDTNHGLGTFEYTLQFCDSNGFEGVESSVSIEVYEIPQSNQPGDLEFLQGAPADNITWILTDELGAGWYHVLLNDAEILTWTTWTNGGEINVTVQTNLAVGYWNYTIQFNNSAGRFGDQDTVNVTIDDLPVVSSCPSAAEVVQNALTTITWVFTDQIGAGTYSLFVNDVAVPGKINIPWSNNTGITITVTTSVVGKFNYTLRFCDSNGFEGAASSVLITVVASGDGGGTQPPDFPVEIVVILIIAAAGAMVAVLFVIRAKRKKRGNYPIV